MLEPRQRDLFGPQAAARDGLTLQQAGVDLLHIVDGKIVEVRLFSSNPAQEDAFWGQ